MNNTINNKDRNSNIELLKIIAMLGIVIGHCRPISTSFWQNNFFQLGSATRCPSLFVLNSLGYLGAYGNAIFIICSSWFLVESNKVSTKKINNMLSDSWFISCLFLCITLSLGFSVSFKDIIKSVLPTTYGVTWFIGCYLIFYFIHPALYVILHRMEKEDLLKLNVFLFITYFIAYYFLPKASFYFNYLIGFCAIYLIIGYAKMYMKQWVDNVTIQRKVFIITSCVMLLILVFLNIAGLHWPFFSDEFGYFSYFNNFLIFLGSFALFNMFRLRDGGGTGSIHILIICLH